MYARFSEIFMIRLHEKYYCTLGMKCGLNLESDGIGLEKLFSKGVMTSLFIR